MRSCRAAVLATCLVVAGCTSGSDEGAPSSSASTTTRSTTTTVPATTTTTVALPPPVPVEWHPCEAGFDCATVTVPVSYAEPSGPTLDLALVRNPADHPDERIGTLLVNPGGPGASGVRRVARGFRVSAEVADRFDIVGFDPRGVGGSTPITCGDAVPAFRATDLSPDSPQEEEALEVAARAVADECLATEGDRLGHLGSADVVHDIEVIRRALGEPRISFVGLSYGTLLGQLWADEYPGSVRALVLDGVVDPASTSASSPSDQAAGVEAATQVMDDACGRDAACAVGAQGGLVEAYDELARRLESGAVSAPGVGPTQLAYAWFYATYDDATWPILGTALRRGLDGDLTGVADLAESFTRIVPYPAFAIISCLDGPHPEGYAAWERSASAYAERSPRFGRTLANELLPCAFWPAGTLEPQEVDAAGAPPILVIGSTGDAATPYQAAQAVARNLDRGALLTVELDGHVALGDSDCAAAVTTRYLVDLTVPEPGARC